MRPVPSNCPTKLGGFIQSVASAAPCSYVANAIIQQKNQIKGRLQVLLGSVRAKASCNVQERCIVPGLTSLPGVRLSIAAEVGLTGL